MFRIGEFSKIAQVSGRLLRYYDEIGLLSPEATDPETGYRYYSARQLPRLNRILVLKELGLSLEQIAKLLEQNTSVSDIRAMLTLRKAQIEQSVQEELTRLRVVETRLEQLDMHGFIQEPDVVLKSVPAQPFLSLREVLPDMSAIQRLVRLIATVVPRAVGQNSLSHIMVLLHSTVYEPEARDVEVGYLLTGKAPSSVRLSEERVLTQHESSALKTAATFVHVGRIVNLHRSYGILGTWIEQKNWHLVGTGREVLIQLPTASEDDEAVVEIQFPVSHIE